MKFESRQQHFRGTPEPHSLGAVHKIGLVVLDTPLFTEAFDKGVSLGQIVSWNTREQVMVHLVLKTTTEPVYDCLRDSVSASNVAGSGNLQLPEIGAGIGIISGHTVVSQSKDNGEEETRRAGHGKVKSNRVKSRESSVSSDKGQGPSVVKHDQGLFSNGVLKSLGLHFKLGIFRGGSKTHGSLEGFVQPGETSQEKNGEVGPLLVLDHGLDESRVLSISLQLTEGLRLRFRPR
jgi:hypothetical protein